MIHVIPTPDCTQCFRKLINFRRDKEFDLDRIQIGDGSCDKLKPTSNQAQSDLDWIKKFADLYFSALNEQIAIALAVLHIFKQQVMNVRETERVNHVMHEVECWAFQQAHRAGLT